MITWRNIRLDLRYLNNGIMFYAFVYAVGCWIYFQQFAGYSDHDLTDIAPILALALCSFTHTASERADRVADRITIEHGGLIRRLASRMASILIYNCLLVIVAIYLSALAVGRPPSARLIITAIFVSAVLATAGVIIAAALPHPIFAMALTIALVAWGNDNPRTNGFSGAIYGMIHANSELQLADRFAGFQIFWFALGLLAAPLALGYLNLSVAIPMLRQRMKKARLPRWLNLRPTFLAKLFISQFTNPLPALATIFALCLFSYGTLSAAAKLSDLGVGDDYFSIFPGLLLVNILPALLLSSSSQRPEIYEQEASLFKSPKQALFARTLQTAGIAALSVTIVILAIASVTSTSFADLRVLRAIALTVSLSPGLAAASIWASLKVRSMPALALISYGLTLPEVTIASLAPNLGAWLPSSLFSALCGGPGPYSSASHQSTPVWLAIAFALVLASWPFVLMLAPGRIGRSWPG